ncbi:Down syndrome cell adhesion molecule-like protein Dscam2, partial [Homalodisca vitripennis]|uniref:Down syndrome cell adhesion molecule-like protein Dscam2 n=1 Tax=Homalodisca vitripennis TaxID=197043 RepID=UPI001EEC8719
VVDGREELNHGKRNLPSQHMSYEAKGLQPHVEYQFWVTASTRVGEGQSSRVVAQVPTSRVPAKITSFGGLVLRPWRSSVSLPCHVVGAPQPRREWLRDDRPLQISTGHNIQLMESGEVVIPVSSGQTATTTRVTLKTTSAPTAYTTRWLCK